MVTTVVPIVALVRLVQPSKALGVRDGIAAVDLVFQVNANTHKQREHLA